MTLLSTHPAADLTTYLATLNGRCQHGYHHTQGCGDCAPVAPGITSDEWRLFRSALVEAAVGGVVHQSAVRPLIRGRIEPKHVGLAYRRAIREGLLVQAGHEESDDVAGKNAGRLEPRYELRSAA